MSSKTVAAILAREAKKRPAPKKAQKQDADKGVLDVVVAHPPTVAS